MTNKSVILFVFLFVATSSENTDPTPFFPGVYQLVEPVEHAECPTWDTRNNILYYVNIPAGQIFRYDYALSSQTFITLNGGVAPVIPSKNNPDLLIAGLDRQVVAVEWDGITDPSETRVLANLSIQFPTSSTNDGKADNKGRLWIGTMGRADSSGVKPNEGELYQVTCDNLDSPTVEVANVTVSNGLAWNAANDKFFYIDTPTNQIFEYAYEEETGTISSPRIVFDTANYAHIITGGPDGMTIDEDDNLWVALYGGGAVIHVNSTSGELLHVVPLPAEYVTSAIWGGPDLDILYVTTSRIGLSEDQRLQQPAAGAVFAVVGLGTRGRPVFGVDLIQHVDDETCHGNNISNEV